MFGVEGFDPWTGVEGKYDSSNPRVLVLGEVQVDAPLSDRDGILRKLRAGHDLVFTNFDQAVLGKRRWAEGYRDAVREFWERTLFYNYNVTRVARQGATPADGIHARLLQKMLSTYKPTHVIVWGDSNWATIAVEGAAWQDEAEIRCGPNGEPCRSVAVDGHRTLFTRVSHPSAGFDHERWSALLSRFLSLAPAAS
jgi:hypothetical protein